MTRTPNLAIHVVGANHQGLYDVAFNVEQDSQIAFDDYGINRFAIVRAEPMDFVGAQAGVEGVLSKNLPDFTNPDVRWNQL